VVGPGAGAIDIEGGCPDGAPTQVDTAAKSDQLVIGVGIGETTDLSQTSRFEYRLPTRGSRAAVEALAPGVPWVLLWLDGPKPAANADVTPTLRLSVADDGG
jgi:hypothetical protein